MALTARHVTDMAAEGVAIGAKIVDLYYEVKQIVQRNNDQSIAWAADPLPAYITAALQTDGNIDGMKCTPAQVSTLFFALSQFIAYGDVGHLGTINVTE